jgi:hypothetical protein
MDKKPSFLWALAVGLVFPVLQVLIYFVRFGGLNPEAPLSDYLLFFLGGFLAGVGLIYFLRRSLVGGVMGVVGVLLLGVSPSVFITGVGYFLGRAFSKK